MTTPPTINKNFQVKITKPEWLEWQFPNAATSEHTYEFPFTTDGYDTNFERARVGMKAPDDNIALDRTGVITVEYVQKDGDPPEYAEHAKTLIVPVTFVNDDIAGFHLAPHSAMPFTPYCPSSVAAECYGYEVDIDEGESARYSLRLDTEPLEPVTIRATHWRGVRVIENSEFTYDSTNWNSSTPPFIKVKANRFAFDARDRYAEVRYQVTSLGSDYKNLHLPPLRVTIKNIDPS